MEQLNAALAVIGATIVLVALFSKLLKKSPVQEPIVAVLIGVAAGPYALDWLDVAEWGDETAILEQAARLTLAIGLMGVALRVRRDSVRALWRPVAALLAIGMVGMWLASAALAGWLLGLSFWAALLLGAVVTPTDPVVASSIVTGKFATTHLPVRVRDTISLESGANDGLAYLFVMLPAFALQHGGEAQWERWLTESLLVGVIGAIAAGAAVGYAAARLLEWAHSRDIVEEISLLGYTAAFSLLTLGAAALFELDALISVFTAGLVFNLATDRGEEHEEQRIQEAVAKLFTLPMFVIFGLALPFREWLEMGYPLLGLTILILLLRRPPVVGAILPMMRGPLTGRDSAYIAWFGPVGIAAIYYATFAERLVHDPMLWHAGSAVVFASILAHGVSAAPLTRWYARRPGPAPSRT